MKHAREDYNRIQDPSGKIPDDEPVFLLRAQDRTATQCVEFWIRMNRTLDDRDMKGIKMAEDHVKLMRKWPIQKTADVPA